MKFVHFRDRDEADLEIDTIVSQLRLEKPFSIPSNSFHSLFHIFRAKEQENPNGDDRNFSQLR